MSRECFATGETVSVGGETGLWTVVHDDGNRVVVEQKKSLCVEDTTDNDPTTNTVQIVNGPNVFSTAVVSVVTPFPLAVVTTSHDYTTAIENIIMEATGNAAGSFWDPTAYLDRWIPLRALGGNYIMLRRSPLSSAGLAPLIMFPRIENAGLELWFHSTWYGDTMQLTDVDVWDLCPAGQFWPKCLWCDRFHLPFDGSFCHRAIHRHQRFHAAYIAPIVAEDVGSTRRQQLSADLRASTQAWAVPVVNLVGAFLNEQPLP